MAVRISSARCACIFSGISRRSTLASASFFRSKAGRLSSGPAIFCKYSRAATELRAHHRGGSHAGFGHFSLYRRSSAWDFRQRRALHGERLGHDHVVHALAAESLHSHNELTADHIGGTGAGGRPASRAHRLHKAAVLGLIASSATAASLVFVPIGAFLADAILHMPMWLCASTMPGITYWPVASIAFTPGAE